MMMNLVRKNFSSKRRNFLKGVSVSVLATMFDHRLLAVSSATSASAFPSRQLLKPNLLQSLDTRNLAKMIHDRQVVDDMETHRGWTATPAVRLSYTEDRARKGRHSLRATILQRDEDHIRSARAKNGSFNGQAILFEGLPGAAVLTRHFASPQDWSDYNRLSLWCFVHSGQPLNALALEFICEGASAGPNDPVAVHYIGDLIPGEWNQLTWEIAEYQRDKVVSFTIFQPRWGIPIAGGSPIMTYDFDMLELQRVDAEQVEGWAIRQDKISYSHVGYETGSTKFALAAAGPEQSFQILDTHGKVRATFPVTSISNRRGSWRGLDFSSFRDVGDFHLRCGNAVGEPFKINDAIWRTVAEATLNGFYGLRCGYAVPGVHDACHLDVFYEHDGQNICLAGGWHDAANLTQNANNTHLSIFSLITLADATRAAGYPDLANRAEEEARWGLEWSLRLRLSPGRRCASNPASYYTDSRKGTEDDVLADESRVREDPFTIILSVLASARSGRSLKSRSPEFSRLLQKAAIEDFAAILPKIDVRGAVPSDMNQGSTADQLGYASLAATELFRLTGDISYRDEAVRFAAGILETQEQRFVSGIPIAGYFYDDTHQKRITHEFHSSFEEGRLLALEALCELFPNHPEWMNWYQGVMLYSEFFCAKGTEASAPFDILPSAVWRRGDIDAEEPDDRMGKMLSAKPSGLFPTSPTPALIKQHMLEQFEAAADLGEEHRLRVFPLWYDHIRHGSTVIQLTKAIGLAAGARLRGKPLLQNIVERQMQWVLGLNPFSRSLMYGVGKDWWQNFAVEIPNLVGGLSVGMNSYSQDAPAWGNNAVFPYKEIWVYSSCRAALLLADIMAPKPSVIAPVEASAKLVGKNIVELRIAGSATPLPIEIRARNLGAVSRQVTLDQNGHIARFTVGDTTQAWTIVIVAQGDIMKRVELFGTVSPLASIE